MDKERKLHGDLVESWVVGEQKAGLPMSGDRVERIQRTVAMDLERLSRLRTVTRSAHAPRRTPEASKKVLENGKTLFKRPVPTAPDAPLERCACGQCKVCRMTMRVAMLMSPDSTGAPMYPGPYRHINDEIWSWRLGVGPYRGISQRDGAARMLRMIEDICDRSNALPGLGNWWVK